MKLINNISLYRVPVNYNFLDSDTDIFATNSLNHRFNLHPPNRLRPGHFPIQKIKTPVNRAF